MKVFVARKSSFSFLPLQQNVFSVGLLYKVPIENIEALKIKS